MMGVLAHPVPARASNLRLHPTASVAATCLCASAATQTLCRGVRSLPKPCQLSPPQPRQAQAVWHINAIPVQQAVAEEKMDATLSTALLPPRRPTVSLHPTGPGGNDHSASEQLLNVATSVPFVLVGYDLLRNKQTSPEVRRVGASLMLAGGAAIGYHATSNSGRAPRLRSALRKLDHWTVSLATAALIRAANPMLPQAAQFASASSLALVPFLPTAVTLSNVATIELELLRRARKQKAIRGAYGRHVAVLVVGAACYGGESMAIRHNISWVHSIWHCAAAAAVSSGAKLL